MPKVIITKVCKILTVVSFLALIDLFTKYKQGIYKSTNIDVDYAKALWPILLSDKCKFLDDWIAFIDKDGCKSIKKD